MNDLIGRIGGGGFLLKNFFVVAVVFNNRNLNCGGNGYGFIYLPGSLLDPCSQYQWTVTATYTNGTSSMVSSMQTCVYTVLEPPHDGVCILSNGSAHIFSGQSITVTEYSSVRIECFDWKLGCSNSSGSLLYGGYISNRNGEVFTGYSINPEIEVLSMMLLTLRF
jgi:hypothetical protein